MDVIMLSKAIMKSDSKLPAIDIIQDWIDKYLFFLMLVIGIAYMVIAKWLNWQQWYVTTGPVAIIVFYGLLMAKSKRYHIRGDRAGDNLYYLGFLYTLSSLAISLIQYSLGANTIDEIITNFGIALFTTIAGMSGRVLMNQMREDIVDIEVNTRVALTEAVKMLRSEMYHSVEDINQLRKSTYQSMTESNHQSLGLMAELCQTTQEAQRQMLESMNESRQKQSDMITKFAIDTLNSIQESKRQSVEAINQFCQTTQDTNRNILNNMGQSIKSATDSYATTLTSVLSTFESQMKDMNLNAAKLTKNTEKIVVSSEKLWQRLEAIKAPSDIIDTKLDTVTNKLLKGADCFEQSAQALQKQSNALGGFIEKSEIVTEKTIIIVTEMQNQLQITHDVQAHIGGISQVLVTLRENMANLNQSVSEWINQQQKQAQFMQKNFEEDVGFIRQYRDKTKELSDDSIQMIGAINTSAKSLYQSTGLMSTTFSQLNSDLEKLSSTTGETVRVASEQHGILQHQYRSLLELTQTLENQSRAIIINLKQLPDVQQDFNKVSQYVRELETLFSSTSKTLHNALETHQRIFTVSREQLESDITYSRNSREALEQEAARTRTAAAEMNATLVSLANSIVESLNAPRTS